MTDTLLWWWSLCVLRILRAMPAGAYAPGRSTLTGLVEREARRRVATGPPGWVLGRGLTTYFHITSMVTETGKNHNISRGRIQVSVWNWTTSRWFVNDVRQTQPRPKAANEDCMLECKDCVRRRSQQILVEWENFDMRYLVWVNAGELVQANWI